MPNEGHLLVIPKYEGKQNVSFLSIPEVGQKKERYIPSSYAKIWGETKCQLPEYPRSGLKAMSVERERKKE